MSTEIDSIIIEASKWFTLSELSKLLGIDIDTATQQVETWQLEGKLFVIQIDGISLIPSYALASNGEPLTIIQSVLSVFCDRKSAQAIAAWFASINGWLGGISPIEAIAADRSEDVINAAYAELKSLEHG